MNRLIGLQPSQAISLIKALKMSTTTAFIQINQEEFGKNQNKRKKGELVIADSIPRKNLTVNVGLCLLIKCAGWAP